MQTRIRIPNKYISANRRRLGLSLKKLANLAGVSQTTVYTVERDFFAMPDSRKLVELQIARLIELEAKQHEGAE